LSFAMTTTKKQASSNSCGASNISGSMQKVSYFDCTLIGYFAHCYCGISYTPSCPACPSLLGATYLIATSHHGLFKGWLTADVVWAVPLQVQQLLIPGSMMDRIKSDQNGIIILFSHYVVLFPPKAGLVLRGVPV
jgi:hypothetical protein